MYCVGEVIVIVNHVAIVTVCGLYLYIPWFVCVLCAACVWQILFYFVRAG